MYNDFQYQQKHIYFPKLMKSAQVNRDLFVCMEDWYQCLRDKTQSLSVWEAEYKELESLRKAITESMCHISRPPPAPPLPTPAEPLWDSPALPHTPAAVRVLSLRALLTVWILVALLYGKAMHLGSQQQDKLSRVWGRHKETEKLMGGLHNAAAHASRRSCIAMFRVQSGFCFFLIYKKMSLVIPLVVT